MKKVLIITDLFHASPRIPAISKYLRDFGWEPTLLTTPIGKNPEGRLGPPNDFTKDFRVIEVPYTSIIIHLKKLFGFRQGEGSRAQLEKKFGDATLLRRLLKKVMILTAAFLVYPDEMRSWRHPAINNGKDLLSDENFDAILSSSSPVTSHRIAKTLSARFNIPWIADFRDLWTQNHNYPYPKVRKMLETQMEKRTISHASSLSTVSESTANKLRKRYSSKVVNIIHNGFDPETINDPPKLLTKKFTITYTGSIIYSGKQDPNKLFMTIKDLVVNGTIDKQKVWIRFYGTPHPIINEGAKKYGIEDIVTQHGLVSRTDTFAKQKESQVLLAYGWEDDYETGVFPIKIFEYFAARRPILVTGGTPRESFRKMIDKTKAGKHAIEIVEIKKILTEYYEEFLRNGSVGYHGIPQEMDKYSYRVAAKKFSELFDRTLLKDS